MPGKVNIRPGVSVLSVLRHLNYKPWFALAEFVDNALQSYLQNREQLRATDREGLNCRVAIKLESEPPSRLTIRDNAAGIREADYARAFRAAEIPTDRSGLSEFGMGMKSAACWFAPQWYVRTSALWEPFEKTIQFDIATIVRDSLEELMVKSRPTGVNDHFTEVVLTNLYKTPQGATVRKIKDHLASIYRSFIREGDLELSFNDDVLSYSSPAILRAPKYDELSGRARVWRKEIDFDFGLGLRARGFAALRERGSTSEAGFALFRRKRLIQGSADEGYRPEFIFGRSNSYRYQRLFGELELDGFDVSHTKDGFRWDENEEVFLQILKEKLDEGDLPLLQQAEQYRSRISRDDEQMRGIATSVTQRTAEVIQRDAPPIVERLGASVPEDTPPASLSSASALARRVIDAELSGQRWRILLELSTDPAVGDWVELSDAATPGSDGAYKDVRSVGVRLSLSHPFTQRYAGADESNLEVLVRIAAAIGLAEAAARSSGVRQAGTVRRNINDLLRNALANP
jgi:hypothetical protein